MGLAISSRRVDGSEIFKRHPPVLQLFFSSACRILLDLWTFSPLRARARYSKICVPLTTNIKTLTTSRDF